MKILVVMIATIAAAVTAYAFWPLKFETYYIPVDVERGWIIVDFNNPSCEPLEENRFRRIYKIPRTGYLCTSTPPTKDWVRQSFYSADAMGKLKEIKEGQDFFHFKRLFGTFGSCTVVADAFWYKPGDKLQTDEFQFVEKYRPECR